MIARWNVVDIVTCNQIFYRVSDERFWRSKDGGKVKDLVDLGLASQRRWIMKIKIQETEVALGMCKISWLGSICCKMKNIKANVMFNLRFESVVIYVAKDLDD